MRAEDFAIQAHADQRYGDLPYSAHLRAVVGVLQEFGYHEPWTEAAWLHDTLEDTPVTREQLATTFGPSVAALVWAVTGEGADRKARLQSAYEKLRIFRPAVVLKLADRIANVREALSGNPRFLRMYRSEHPGFRAALYPAGDWRMWECLDSLLGP